MELLPMFSLLAASIANAFEIIGVYEAFNTKYLRKIGDFIKRKLPGWLVSPIIGCPKCMSSIHGTLFYIMIFGGDSIIEWLFYIPIVCGAVVIFGRK